MNKFVPNPGQPAGPARYEDLERMFESPDGQRMIDAEFHSALESAGDGFSRRRWLQLMGASLALGAAGCRHENQQIVPHSFRPAGRNPGVPVTYSTMIDFAGVARPLRATSYDGRPVKLDGNRLHPDSMGSSDSFTQARILELYDPDRLRSPRRRDGEKLVDVSRDEALAAGREILGQAKLQGVAILAEPGSSPSLAAVRKDFESRGGKWFEWTSIGDDNTRAGAKAAFNKAVRAQYHLDQAAVIVTLDADPLGLDPAGLKNSRKFAAGRDVDHGKMSRMYVVECDYSLTGASADHRIAVPASKIAAFTASLAAGIKARTKGGSVDKGLSYRKRVLAAMAQDLVDHAGAGVIVAGERQPPEVHAMVHRLNADLGNHGKTIVFTDLADADRPGLLESAVNLASALESGEIQSLVILGGNPVYDFPANVDLAAAIGGLKSSLHLTLHQNETSRACSQMVDLAHPLESWGDGIAHDGSWCVAQPLIAPLFGAMSPMETLATMMGSQAASGLELVRKTAAAVITSDFETRWNQAVHDGFVEGSAAASVEVVAGATVFPPADDSWDAGWNSASGEVEFVFAPSRSIYDGRFGNSSWLQELPDFISKVTWENAALVSPKTAEALGLKQNTLANFDIGNVTLRIPVHVTPGQAEGTVSVEIGYGRTAAGRVGGDVVNGVEPVGVNLAPARDVANWHYRTGVRATRTATTHTLATVQEIWTTDKTGRDEIQRRMFVDKSNGNRSALIREGTWASYQDFSKQHPAVEHSGAGEAPEAHSSAGNNRGALPVIGGIALTPASLNGAQDKQAADPHDAAHHVQWPEGFHMHHALADLTPGVRKLYNPNHDNKWGMSIDLNSCTGCSSCMTACQAENNIPIVGKWQVWRGREMHWLRIDRYFGENLYSHEASEAGEMQITHQPVTCHHCENAPCETVCPVAATVHSDEGLNDMVYNRCIGTRYCGNNCPYKVRRFNYLNYSDAETLLKYPNADRLSKEDRSLQNLMMNPEVTIRSRGVMEKCTYCVQRIQNVKITAKNQNRKIGPNEIETACQDACPTGAIRFGDLLNPASDVAMAHANSRSYTLLEELNNIPRTKYLARVRNPHPSLVDHVGSAVGPGGAATAAAHGPAA